LAHRLNSRIFAVDNAVRMYQFQAEAVDVISTSACIATPFLRTFTITSDFIALHFIAFHCI
jgi:hypothetical protein